MASQAFTLIYLRHKIVGFFSLVTKGWENVRFFHGKWLKHSESVDCEEFSLS